jgi:hypothetical protein
VEAITQPTKPINATLRALPIINGVWLFSMILYVVATEKIIPHRASHLNPQAQLHAIRYVSRAYPLQHSFIARQQPALVRGARTSRQNRLISLGPCLVAHPFCGGQEKHTMHKREIQIGKSG